MVLGSLACGCSLSAARLFFPESHLPHISRKAPFQVYWARHSYCWCTWCRFGLKAHQSKQEKLPKLVYIPEMLPWKFKGKMAFWWDKNGGCFGYSHFPQPLLATKDKSFSLHRSPWWSLPLYRCRTILSWPFSLKGNSTLGPWWSQSDLTWLDEDSRAFWCFAYWQL